MIKSFEPRVIGGSSIFDSHKPWLCPSNPGSDFSNLTCGYGRVVDCCTMFPDTDVRECNRCGKQWLSGCDFDEDMS